MIGHFNRLFARHGKFIFAVISVVIGISFIGFFSPETMGILSGKQGGRSAVSFVAFGKNIKNEDLQKRDVLSSIYFLFTRDYRSYFNRPNPSQDLIFLEAADQLGIVTSNDEVEDFIKSSAAVQKDGKFDKATYVKFLEDQVKPRRLKEKDFYDAVRQGLTLTKVYGYVTGSVVVSDSEAKEYYNNIYTKITAKVARFKSSDYVDDIKVSNNDVKDYFEKKKDSYMDPAQFKVLAAKFNFVAFEDEAKKALTEEKIKTYYESHKAEYKKDDKEQPLEAVKAKVIAAMIKPKVKDAAFNKANIFANEAYGAIKDLETMKEKIDAFTKLYDEMTADAKVGVCLELDWFEEGATTIPKVLSGAEISAAAAEIYHEIPVSDAINGKRASYVLLLTDKKDKAHSSFESVKEKVEIKLEAEEALKEAREGKAGAREFVAKVAAGIAKGTAFAELPNKEKLVSLKPFSFQEKPEASVENRNDIANLANTTATGNISKVRDVVNGAIAVYVESRAVPTAEEFEKKKDQIKNELRREKEAAAMSDFHNWIQSNIK